MRAPRVARLAVGLDLEDEAIPVGTLAWVEADRRAAFQYDAGFLARNLAISPFHLPPQPGVIMAPAAPFDGLHGVFADSLPDGWGKLLIDRHVAKLGQNPAALSPLDRLAFVGRHGMGALTYVPERTLGDSSAEMADLDWFARQARNIEAGNAQASIDELLRANGGSAGARPKILLLRDRDTGACRLDVGQPPGPGEDAWLVKLPSRVDRQHTGRVEHAYALMARAAGIDMPETMLLHGASGAAFFAVRRFDRAAPGHVHVHTLAGLVNADFRTPSLDYDDLMKVTRLLTRDTAQVQQAYRRMVFNVLAGNRDDHAKNHAFAKARDGAWRLTPAYDLTPSDGPAGQHNLSVAGEGRAPGPDDFTRAATRASIGHTAARRIEDAVAAEVASWSSHAATAGVPRSRTLAIKPALGRLR